MYNLLAGVSKELRRLELGVKRIQAPVFKGIDTPKGIKKAFIDAFGDKDQCGMELHVLRIGHKTFCEPMEYWPSVDAFFTYDKGIDRAICSLSEGSTWIVIHEREFTGLVNYTISEENTEDEIHRMIKTFIEYEIEALLHKEYYRIYPLTKEAKKFIKDSGFDDDELDNGPTTTIRRIQNLYAEKFLLVHLDDEHAATDEDSVEATTEDVIRYIKSDKWKNS